MKKLLLSIILLSLLNLNANEENPFKLQELLKTGRKLKTSQLVVAAHTCNPKFPFQTEDDDQDEFRNLDSVEVYLKALKEDNNQKSLSKQEINVAVRNIIVLKHHGAVVTAAHITDLRPLLAIFSHLDIKK